LWRVVGGKEYHAEWRYEEVSTVVRGSSVPGEVEGEGGEGLERMVPYTGREFGRCALRSGRRVEGSCG